MISINNTLTPKITKPKIKKLKKWTINIKTFPLQKHEKENEKTNRSEELFVSHIKGLYLEYIKNSYNSIISRQTKQFKN